MRMIAHNMDFGIFRIFSWDFILWLALTIFFGHDRYYVSGGGGVVLTKSKSDLRSISLDWTPFDSQLLPMSNGSASGSGVYFLVKYCEDSPWDDTPRSCQSFQTNETQAELRDLRPSTKYLVNVEEMPGRAGRMLAGSSGATLSDRLDGSKDGDTFLDKSNAFAIETQKYAVRNVDCKKGQTEVTIETGEDFEGVISVQKPDGRPDSRCLIRGYGTAQRTYVLPINHTVCAMEFLEEHASLVLGSDRSLRISCNYQPAMIRLETGMGRGSRVIQIGSDDDMRRAPSSAAASAAVAAPLSSSPRPTINPSPAPPVTVVRAAQGRRNRLSLVGAVSSGERKQEFWQPVTREVPAKIQSTQTAGDFGDFYGESSPVPVLQQHGFLSGGGGPATTTTAAVGSLGWQDGRTEGPSGATAVEPHLNLRDFLGNDVLVAANFTHQQDVAIVHEHPGPRSTGITLLQVVAITGTCSLAAIMIVCFLIWLIVFREACSRHRSSKRSSASEEQLRFG